MALLLLIEPITEDTANLGGIDMAYAHDLPDALLQFDTPAAIQVRAKLRPTVAANQIAFSSGISESKPRGTAIPF